MRYICLFVFGLLSFSSNAQVDFLDYKEQQLTTNPKMIYLKAASSANIQHKLFNQKVLQNRKTTDFLNLNFDNFTISHNSPEGQKLIKTHHLGSEIGLLFLDHEGNFIYHYQNLPKMDSWDSYPLKAMEKLLELVGQVGQLEYQDPIKLWADKTEPTLAVKQIINLNQGFNNYAHELYNRFIQKEEVQQLPEVLDLTINMIDRRNDAAVNQFVKHHEIYQSKLGEALYDSIAQNLASSRAWQINTEIKTFEDLMHHAEKVHAFFRLNEQNRELWIINFALGYCMEMRLDFQVDIKYYQIILQSALDQSKNKEDKAQAYYYAASNLAYTNSNSKEELKTAIAWAEKSLELGYNKEYAAKTLSLLYENWGDDEKAESYKKMSKEE